MFSKAIVRKPGKSLVNGLTEAGLGVPDYDLAVNQHRNYVNALKSCGVEVIELEADENYPDSTFVEDVALLTPKVAIITHPGAVSRRGETAGMKKVVSQHYEQVEEIQGPGTVDAGDVMMVGSHYYIGLSERTDQAGADQLISILEKYGMSGSTIELKHVLHLKTGVAYLEHNKLVACGEFLEKDELKRFNVIEIPAAESYAANCIWINDKVIIPAGHPASCERIKDAGYEVLEIDVSEFEKLDGGISCLSLRF